jgi:hypothetical protein
MQFFEDNWCRVWKVESSPTNFPPSMRVPEILPGPVPEILAGFLEGRRDEEPEACETLMDCWQSTLSAGRAGRELTRRALGGGVRARYEARGGAGSDQRGSGARA